MEIRRAQETDGPAIMSFIDRHWKRGHALGTSSSLFNWQHRDPQGGYTYMLAVEDEEILGVLGYIPSRLFEQSASNVVWLALWKIRDDVKRPALGLQLLRALEHTEPHETIAVNGINASLPPMYKALGYQVVRLSQHYVTNPLHVKRILRGQNEWPVPKFGEASFVTLNESNLAGIELKHKTLPEKGPSYFINRFLRHPIYRYNVHLLQHNARQALIATRIATAGDAKVLRIVDFAGDVGVLAESGSAFAQLMKREFIEYADIFQHGLCVEALERAGFAPVTAAIVVPNYFEPFLAANGDIISAFKSKSELPFVICRADGDQDRPNQIFPQ